MSTKHIEARERVISAVLLLLSTERAPEHANAAADAEHTDELVALTARDLTRATDALPADQRPVGWNTPDVAQAVEESWAVLLDVDGIGTYAYPFDEHELACRFAAYLTAEVDPATVAPQRELGPARPGVVWRSPLIELLNWREHILDERSDRLGEAANALERLESLGRIDRVTAAELSHAVGIITLTKLDETIRAAERGEGR